MVHLEVELEEVGQDALSVMGEWPVWKTMRPGSLYGGVAEEVSRLRNVAGC